MVGTIGPLVRRAPHIWAVSSTLFAAGCVTGAVLLGAATSLGGTLVPPLIRETRAWWGALAAIAGVLAMRDLGLVWVPLPIRHATTTRTWWHRFGPYRTAILWGLQLGVGISTVVPYGAFYLLLLGVLWEGSPFLGARLLAVYGLARAAPTILGAIPIARGVSPRVVSEWGMGSRELLFYRLNGLAGLLVMFAAIGRAISEYQPLD